jgi:hypothetical protein
MRDYDPAIGGYTQPEPLGLAGDINLYRYARSNPLIYFDPDGREATAVRSGPISSGARAATGVGSRAISALGPVGAVAGAGLGGYELGTLIYPIIEPTLSAGIDWICSAATSPSRTERCNTAFKNCKGWRTDPAWLNLCAKSLQQCLNTNLPVIFPSGDIVK